MKKIIFPSVAQQLNGVDCGVFAIAFATSLVFGHDPQNITYTYSLMRNHVFKLLSGNILTL